MKENGLMNALGKYLLVVGLAAMGFAMGCEKKEEAPSADAPAEEAKEAPAEEANEAPAEAPAEEAAAEPAEGDDGEEPEAPPASQ